MLFNIQLCWLIFLPRLDLWRTAALEGAHDWKQLCLSRHVSSACPPLCAITVVPGHVQDLALALQVTTSLEHSTKTFGLEQLLQR